MRLILMALMTGFLAMTGLTPAHAEIGTYKFDKPHTQVLFSVNHLGFSNSYGRFTDYDGTIIFDQGEPEKSKVDVTIKTASLTMDDEKWDEHLKSKDFFDVENFPDMTFKSINILKTGDNTAQISGELTIKGITKVVTLDTKFNSVGKHPMKDEMMAGFSATAHIKRSDFGMSYGVPMVGDDVNIIIEVEAIEEGKGATNP